MIHGLLWQFYVLCPFYFSSYLAEEETARVKSDKFGRSAKFGQRPCLFHILIIVIKVN